MNIATEATERDFRMLHNYYRQCLPYDGHGRHAVGGKGFARTGWYRGKRVPMYEQQRFDAALRQIETEFKTRFGKAFH